MKLTLNLYNIDAFLIYIKQNNITISNLKIDGNEIYFETSYRNYKKIKKNYKEMEILKHSYVSNIMMNKINSITIIVMLIISSFFMVDLESRLFRIEINGVSKEITEEISKLVLDNDIKLYNKKPTFKEIDQLEKNIYHELNRKISLISIRLYGSYLIINYQKRQEPISIEENKTKIFSKCDAIIKDYDITSGNIIVHRNQYVKKGELLVDDTIIRNEKMFYVGTKGYVYGYTYYTNNIKLNQNLDDSDVLDVLDDFRYSITKDFCLGEYIDKETLLKKNDRELIIHYTCVEILNSY